MQTTEVLSGQTWVDLTLQQLGDENKLFELADLNDAGITDLVEAGEIIVSPDHDFSMKQIVNILKVNRPASSLKGLPGDLEEGIEYWAIEYDFVVS